MSRVGKVPAALNLSRSVEGAQQRHCTRRRFSKIALRMGAAPSNSGRSAALISKGCVTCYVTLERLQHLLWEICAAAPSLRYTCPHENFLLYRRSDLYLGSILKSQELPLLKLAPQQKIKHRKLIKFKSRKGLILLLSLFNLLIPLKKQQKKL